MSTIEACTHDFLFECEDVIIEEHVQLLVRVIDAELLERVGREVLEAEYVEYAECTCGVTAVSGAAVHVTHEPRERACVQRAGHRVTIFARLQTI